METLKSSLNVNVIVTLLALVVTFGLTSCSLTSTATKEDEGSSYSKFNDRGELLRLDGYRENGSMLELR
jgi:hypothetical protein